MILATKKRRHQVTSLCLGDLVAEQLKREKI